MELLPYHIEKQLDRKEKIQYYNRILEYAKVQSSKKASIMSLGQNLMSKFYMHKFYNNLLNIEETQNLPNHPAIILCNHSTAHDIFSMYIATQKLGLPTSVMVATDCLSPASIAVFRTAQSVFLDRRNKYSSSNSILNASATLLGWKYLVIFGESTWNLHPTKAMQDIKRGASMIAAITGFPVIPTVLEYVEKSNVVEQENEIYQKIVLRFGQPCEVTPTDDLSYKTLEFQRQMEQMRKEIWLKHGIEKQDIASINTNIYLNHTYLKKFGVFGFTYNSEYEAQFLRSNTGDTTENEYCLNEFSEFVPGITYQKRK